MATGLIFPGNGAAGSDIRLVWSGANLLPRTAHTAIWLMNYSQQNAYYATFWHSHNDGAFHGSMYEYGTHPYPSSGNRNPVSGLDAGNATSGAAHRHEIAGLGAGDWISTPDPSGIGNPSLSLVTGQFLLQMRKCEIIGGTTLRHTFYPDMIGNPTFSIVVDQPLANLNTPTNPAAYWGCSDWRSGQPSSGRNDETTFGILRGLKMFSTGLTFADGLTEGQNTGNSPVTAAGIASVWYMNVNPTPTDVSDKSGAGHNPVFANANRPTLYTVTDPDTTAPTLSSPTSSQLAQTTVTPRVTTDEANGTLYVVLVPSGNRPSAAQIKAHQNASGSAAIAYNSLTVSTTGAQTYPQLTGLTENTAYTLAYMHEDAAGNQSTPAYYDFTTTQYVPVFSFAPSTVNVVQGGFGVQAQMDRDGALYAVALLKGSAAPSAAQIAAGHDAAGGTTAVADADSNESVTAAVTYTLTFDSIGVGSTTDDPLYDWYIVGKHLDQYTSVVQGSQLTAAAAGKQMLVADVPWPAGAYSVFQGASPAVADGDVLEIDQVTSRGGTITPAADGTFTITP